MSTIEVNKITPVDGGTNTTLGDSGDTIQVPSGVTLDIASGATLDATGATVSGITSTTINNNADNRVITGSGTANTLNGEANLTFSATGELAVTSSDSASGTQTLKVATTGNANPAYTNLVFKTGGNTSGCWIKGVQASGGNDGRLEFYTNLAGSVVERIRVMANGKTITKANNNGAEGLQVLHSGDANPYGIFIYFDSTNPNNSANYFARGDSTTGAKFFIYSNGNMVNSNNSYGGISDLKLKEQVKDSSSQWEDIKALKIKKYKFKKDVAEGDSDNLWQLGVIAQDLETSGMNGLVEESPDTEATLDEDGQTYHKDLGTTTKSVKYSVLYMKSIKALQEAITKIETLEAKVAALESA